MRRGLQRDLARDLRAVDLDGLSGFTAADATIKGNYIGLDVNGSAALPNTAMGVDVAAATNMVVGGPSAYDRNVIAGGTLAIFNNGQGGLTDPQQLHRHECRRDSKRCPAVNDALVTNGDAAHPTIVSNNRFTHAAGTGVAVDVNGVGAQVQGNILGVGTGGPSLCRWAARSA